jgi:hypothetical protein
MITPISYEEYHRIYADHLMRDVDILPEFRIIEVEYYNRDLKWFKTEKHSFSFIELAVINKPIRSLLIT